MKRKVEKNTDLVMGQKMIQTAIENLNQSRKHFQ